MSASFKSKLIATKKSSQCPVCADVSGKCRTPDDNPIVLCMVLTSPLDTAPGYRYLKPTKDGLWAVWQPDDDAKFDRQEWQKRTEVIKQQKTIDTSKLMSLDERDHFYRDWLARGSLNDLDLADLERRGVTDFSIAVSSQIGYIVPFKGLGGKYVGAQWRLRDVENGGRYRWHNLEGGKHFPGTQELPIAVYPCENPTAIALVDSTGVKPRLAAERFGMITIGTAGGLHTSSAIQLKEAIAAFPNLPIVIVPDAGDLINPQIMGNGKRFDLTVRTLRQWKVEPKFLWWNQRTKAENDIDEATLEEIKSAELLIWEEFAALAPNNGDRGFEQDSARTEKSERQNRIESRDRLIAKRVFRFCQYQEDLQRDFLLPSVVNGNEIRYLNYSGFAPNFDLYSDTTCLQGWVGAGKTETMLKSLVPFQNKEIVWVAPRNGLLRQTAKRAKRLGFSVYHYQDSPGKYRSMLEAGAPGLYLMAPDSFKTYAVGNVSWDNVILAIDEFSGIRKEILGKSAELPQFLDAIARCGSLVLADAFLSQIDIRVIQKHRSGTMQILKQEFKKSPTKINWLECRTKAGEISLNHEGIYYSLLDRWMEEKIKRIAIAVDNLGIAKLLDRYLRSKGIKTWLVCSETPQENLSFMEEPDKLIKDGRIEAVLYTPTAQSGLDIQADFDRGLLIATGTLPPLQMLQMLGRCRQCLEWFVSAPRRSSNPDCATPSLDGRKIQQWTKQLSEMFADHEFNAPHPIQGWALWEDLTRNIEKAFCSEYLRHLLDRYFESVQTVEVESDRVSEWRKDAQILKTEDADRTLKANLQNGLKLKDAQKQPKFNSEIWDCKLAEFWLKYPNVANKAISDIGVEEFAEDAIEMTKLFTSRRIEKLRNFVITTEPNQQDDRDLLQYLKERPIHYNAGNFKRLQNIKLFRLLNLVKLVLVANLKEIEADVNAFRAGSEAISQLYQAFLANSKLARLFPFVDSQKGFFDAIKTCLSYLGYEQGSKSIRIKTEDLHPNGKDRNGKQRFCKSKPPYFVYWLLMESSGSAYFRENFDLILEAIRDRISTEREERRKWRERQELPPPGWEAQAA
ncbi:MAG: DEAD/DEAH box helicase family protein [Plectolyngbya sp. WJT66-NPBG17]|jgi:hypothetical protein|nr:DEAD/DEAH box helicase family protein [Plectolyngbya sp. WJT66-NPBG17]